MCLSRPLGIIEFLPIKTNSNAKQLGILLSQIGKGTIKISAAIT
jgi:hypothetical protein